MIRTLIYEPIVWGRHKTNKKENSFNYFKNLAMFLLAFIGHSLRIQLNSLFLTSSYECVMVEWKSNTVALKQFVNHFLLFHKTPQKKSVCAECGRANWLATQMSNAWAGTAFENCRSFGKWAHFRLCVVALCWCVLVLVQLYRMRACPLQNSSIRANKRNFGFCGSSDPVFSFWISFH